MKDIEDQSGPKEIQDSEWKCASNPNPTEQHTWSHTGCRNSPVIPRSETINAQINKTGDDQVKPSMPNWITSLEEELDNKILVVLRDGRKFIGHLRTFDQFGNLVLEHSVERIVADKYFYDIDSNCMIIRGDNILLFGAVDEAKTSILERKPAYEIIEMLRVQEEEEKKSRQRRALSDRSHFGECGED